MDSDGTGDENQQKQCETCFRYFNSQFKLQSHLSAPYRCQVCCKKFSSRVRLSECRFINVIKVQVYYFRMKNQNVFFPLITPNPQPSGQAKHKMQI